MDFYYKGKHLYCEKVKVADIVKKVGTPAFIYSHKTFSENIRRLQKAFRHLNPLICYSMKANSNLAILKTVVKAGSGLDIVSVGELFRARRVKCAGEKIVFAGVGKNEQEIEEAIRYGILLFNVESVPELELINRVARRLGKKARVSLRVNPDVDAKTHRHITTGKSESKFGMDFVVARTLFARRQEFPGLEMCAIHVHIGSQIVTADPFIRAFRKVLAFVDELEQSGVSIRYLNLGGGIGVVYHKEKPLSLESFSRQLTPLFRGRRFRLIFEPGRFVSANAGILAGQVIYVKRTQVKNFAITDAAMNDLIRPSLYDAYHEILPLERKAGRKKEKYDVVGPVCESGDYFAKDRQMARLEAGDFLAIMSSGAYGFVMSSNYNSRPRACEVLVRGSRFAVVRQRETLQDLVSGEKIPALV